MASREPTPEMVAFFEERTRQHIERVRVCLHALAEGSPHRQELLQRATVHDASKFGPEERDPYIWLTEYHRCRRIGESFSYPQGIEARVRAAINHHVTTNRHHPEFHADVRDMTEVDLMEMVCDWTAMAQEYNQDGGSARGWAEKTIGHRLPLSDGQRQFVFATIERLDSKLRQQEDQAG